MYGLVNTAVRDLVISTYGEETWDRIRTRAGLGTGTFIAMDRYDDAVTYDLVAAASEELGVEAFDVLRSFGQYWTRFTADQGYGDTLEFAGHDFVTFLSNLDDMHARVAMSFPDLDPPSFDLEHQADGRLLLHYFSDRAGLAPMVIGLLEGLATRFGQQVTIEHLPADDAVDHDRFLIELAA